VKSSTLSADQEPEQNCLLSIRHLSTELGSQESPVRAVDDVSFDVFAGETLALLGESGCGKSMTALSMMRLLPAGGRIAGGEVQLDDTAVLAQTEKQMRQVRGGRMAMIFQEPMTSLNPVMKIGEQIAESVRLHDSRSAGRIGERVVELLRQVGIPDPVRRAEEYPHQLSGGMKQRVMIAIALAGRPQVLIADEPTTALDVTIQAQVLNLLKDLQQETGMAILLITHDLGVVAEVADRVAVMYAGQIIETATVGQFFESPAHPYSRKLFDSLPSRHKRGQSLAVIRGTVPSLKSRFSRCRFIERCDEQIAACQAQLPPWSGDIDNGVRCHLSQSGQKPASRLQGEVASRVAAESANAAKQQTLLRLQDVKVHFPIQKGVFRRTVGYVKAVDGVSLDIPQGRTLALVGESGCGKTTVGKALLQLIRPTAGQVQFEDTELTQLKGQALRSRRRDLQIIFQDPVSSMNPRMLVEDIIAEGMIAQKIGAGRKQRAERIASLLEQVGLSTDAMTRYPHEFSGGQRQRICVARALAVEPQLIVCDEPTSALDVSVQAQILNLLKQLQDELGLSYLFITHDISVVSYLAHEIAVMYLGRIVESGTVEEILDNPQHPYTRSLLAAVPVPDPQSVRQRQGLSGDMPSPANPPSGCFFHPRCPDAQPQCSQAYPDFSRLSETHRVACVLAQR
jgi:peptide/nickel transport system ATP-binding protein